MRCPRQERALSVLQHAGQAAAAAHRLQSSAHQSTALRKAAHLGQVPQEAVLVVLAFKALACRQRGKTVHRNDGAGQQEPGVRKCKRATKRSSANHLLTRDCTGAEPSLQQLQRAGQERSTGKRHRQAAATHTAGAAAHAELELTRSLGRLPAAPAPTDPSAFQSTSACSAPAPPPL